MTPSFHRLFCRVLPLSLGFASVVGAQPNLSRSSPFIPSNGQTGPAATTENSPIELRGIVISPNGNLYGLYDPVKRQSSWVKVNETGNSYTVKSFNASNESISVEYEGRVLTLALKAAKIDSMPAGSLPPPAPVSTPQLPTNNIVAQAAIGVPSGEAKRLEEIAAEVRRRRDARQSAQQQQPGMSPPGPQAAPTPLPVRPAPANNGSPLPR